MGKRWSCALFSLQKLNHADNPGPMRLGLTVSRKVGNAVVRNRAKRRLRETVRLILKEQSFSGFDLVIVARTASATAPFLQLGQELRRGLATLEHKTKS
jgi:ribonuclease P protein component